MDTRNLTERTALTGFTLRGMPVIAGQVVTLDPFEMNTLAAARCIALDDAANARVPVVDLPGLKPASNIEADAIAARLDELREAARREASRLEQTVADARTKASDDIVAVERSTADRLQAIGREVTQAEAARDQRLAEIQAEVDDAEKAAKNKKAAAGKSGEA